MKLLGRTVAQMHREAEGSLLATQLLLAQGALALPATAKGQTGLPSARKVLLENPDRDPQCHGHVLGSPANEKLLRPLGAGALARPPAAQQ